MLNKNLKTTKHNIMTQKRFHHQLGIVIIRIYPDGTATYNKKRYSSYKSARRALTNHVGFAWEEK